MKKITKLGACLLACGAVLMSGCSGQRAEPEAAQPTEPTEANVPDNVITEVQTEPTLPSSDFTLPESIPETVSEEPQSSSEESSETGSEESQPVPEDLSDGETRALEYLKLLNSNHVHVRFIQVEIYDSETAFSYDREFYIDGEDRIYINDGDRTIVHGGETTYVSDDDMTYCVVDGVDDYGLNFGYDSSLYTLLSAEDADGVHTEIYSIEGQDIVSTWEFYEDGKLRVADRSITESSYDLYDFYIVEYGVEGMDLSVPAGYTEVTEEEFGFNF